MRQKTKISHILQEDLGIKITNFHRYIIRLRKQHDFPFCEPGNMDETPLNFDISVIKLLTQKA